MTPHTGQAVAARTRLRADTTAILVALVACVLGGARPADAQFETPNRQFHNATTFPLDGRHRDLPCESCHRQNVYKGTPTKCYDCHWVRRQDDRFRLQLGTQCEQCHRTTSWSAVRWDHSAMTSMPLGAAHQRLTCQSCHANNTFKTAQTTCASCHMKDYQATKTPNHAAAGFPTACETCHKPADATFSQARFDHGARFPLVGMHAQAACASCHVNNVYRGTPRECVACHRTQYDRTTSPNHASAGFSTDCATCHRPTDTSFRGAGFNHNAVFALVGVHAQASCTSCHSNNVYRGTPRDCVGCHRTQYDRTTSPNHAAAGFSTDCATCHRPTDTSFRGAQFNHNAVFALVGRHAQTACTSCHVNNVYRGTARDCVGCHLTQYQRTTSPNHAAAGFPTTCESCHRNSDTSWTQGTFNHRFPITSGPHRVACSTCHQSSSSFATFTCLVCHEHDRTVMDEKHRGRVGYRYDSLACYSCHPQGRH
jgi:hypothetical protein